MRPLLLLFLLLSVTFVYAQEDPLANKFEWYEKKNNSPRLFVHFDKNIYTNKEVVWFTGYLLQGNEEETPLHQVLLVNLIHLDDRSLILQKKFLIDRGLSFGQFTLPDSLIAGNYLLLAHTDILKNNSPEVLFKQTILIKSNIDPLVKAEVKVLHTALKKGDESQLLISTTAKDGTFLPKPVKITYNYAERTHEKWTDALGQLLVKLPFENQTGQKELKINYTYQKDTGYLFVNVPRKMHQAQVHFFPEGGPLSEGMRQKIGWEIRDEFHRPLSVHAQLLEDGQVIDTLETGSNGIGHFHLRHRSQAIYQLKPIHSSLKDSLYLLPKALPIGISLHLPQTLVRDTLSFQIRSNHPGRKVYIRVHRYAAPIVYYPLVLRSAINQIKIPLKALDRGLHTLLITDSLERPLMERLFFAHYPKTSNDELKIELPTTEFTQRKKISMELTLDRQDLNGIASIAVVQENRLHPLHTNDIETYHYLQNELQDFDPGFQGRVISDSLYVDQLLLIRGWRKYRWTDLLESTPADTAQTLSRLQIEAQVVKKNQHKFLFPSSFTLLNNKEAKILTTDSTGFILIDLPALFSTNERPWYVLLTEKKKDAFQLQIKNHYQLFSRLLSRKLDIPGSSLPSDLQNTMALQLKDDEKAIRLKEVVIQYRADNSMHFLKGVNECGDYVCTYNILNCVNHQADPRNSIPVKGRSYLSTGGGYELMYQGCSTPPPSFQLLDGIYEAKEFYVNHYPDPTEPAFVSTLYWNHGLFLKGKEPLTIEFYTGDITGRFKIILQGVSANELLYKEVSFTVLKSP